MRSSTGLRIGADSLSRLHQRPPPGHVSQVRLFANDTAIYLTIDYGHESNCLQRDMGRLQAWELKWDKEFKSSKCQVVHVTSSRAPFNTRYVLHGQSRRQSLVQGICGRYPQQLGFIKRNVKTKSPIVREMTHHTLVRPQLEYASAIWDPDIQCNIHKIEMAQSRAAGWTMNDYTTTTSVTSLLNYLGWQTLEETRSVAHLCLFYKILNDLMAVPLPEYIQLTHGISRYCHLMTFRQIHTGKDSYKYSFFPLSIVQWNALPESAVIMPPISKTLTGYISFGFTFRPCIHTSVRPFVKNRAC